MSNATHSHERPAAEQGLRLAMRQLASGVSVITTGLAPHRTGFTATSVVSLAVSPPRITVSVNRESSSFAVLRQSGILAVNFLHAGQVDIANRFAGRGGTKGEARFEGASWITLESGASLLSDALASIDAEVEEIIERHSHAIVIGKVLATRVADRGDALLYWRGQYDPFIPTDIAAVA